MSSINSRIIDLQNAIEARRMDQEAPIDPISLSLYELQGWAAGLDEQGKAALLEALNTPGEDGTAGLDLDMEAIDKILADLKG